MLRYRLYDIDVVVNRTLVYATLTVLLAMAFAATALVLGTALGRGSPWTTAGATLVAAAVFRPLRARVQDTVDRRYNRARYHAGRRMADFLEALRAGRAAPEDIEGLLRELLDDPRLELRFFLSDERHVRRRARRTGARDAGRRAGVRADRAPQATARGRPLRRGAAGGASRPAAHARRRRRTRHRDHAPARRAASAALRGTGVARADRRRRECRAPPDRARPPRRRPTAARLDRPRAAPRAAPAHWLHAGPARATRSTTR